MPETFSPTSFVSLLASFTSLLAIHAIISLVFGTRTKKTATLFQKVRWQQAPLSALLAVLLFLSMLAVAGDTSLNDGKVFLRNGGQLITQLLVAFLLIDLYGRFAVEEQR